jgi:uncharacterized membrane protein YdjX (TVP38/TMEM64 family)
MPDLDAADAKPPTKPASLARYAPIAVIALGAAAVFLTGAHRYLSLDALRENYAALRTYVASDFWRALLVYAFAYFAVTALSLPGAGIMSLLGGLLFGALAGTIAVVAAATLGATAIFLAARTAFGEFFRKRAAGFVSRMEEGFSDNAFSYMLLLRLIPAFPFFIVNIAPAFTRIKTRDYALATLIGIIPGAFAYVSAGNGLGTVIEAGGEIELSGLLTKPEILTPIVALSLLALLPLAYRLIKRRGSKSA